MPDRGGVAEALVERLEKRGVERARRSTARPTAEELERQHRRPGRPPARSTASTGCPPSTTRAPLDGARPARLARGAARAGEAASRRRCARSRAGRATGTFLVAATRLGGRHGYDAAGATSRHGRRGDRLHQGAARERAGQRWSRRSTSRPSRKPAASPTRLIDETLRDPGAVEIGHADDLRWTVGLQERAGRAPTPARALGPGHASSSSPARPAASSSAITADLAAASGGTFHLLDLAPAPDRRRPRPRALRDRPRRAEARARRAAQGSAASGATPSSVERELAALERARAALDAIAAVEAPAAARTSTRSTCTDAAAVARGGRRVREQHGRVDVLLHAAGPRDQPLPARQAAARVRPRVRRQGDGWFNLLHALARRCRSAPRSCSARSPAASATAARPTTARPTTCCARRRRTCAAAAGHARHRDRLDRLGGHRHGHPRLDPEDDGDGRHRHAAARGRRARSSAASSSAAGAGGEVLVAGALGDPARGAAPDRRARRRRGVRADRGAARADDRTVAAMGVDERPQRRHRARPGRQPFLDDHRIDGTPVLPGRDGDRGVRRGGAARCCRAGSVDRDRGRRPPRAVQVLPRRAAHARAAGAAPRRRRRVARGRLPAPRAAHAGRPGREQETVHFTGRVRLAREARTAPAAGRVPDAGDAASVGHDDVYRVYFHGPAYRVLERAWRHDGEVVGRARPTLPPNHQPAGAADWSRRRGCSSSASRRRGCGSSAPPAGWRCRPTSTAW